MTTPTNGMKRYYIATFITAMLTFIASVAVSGFMFAYEFGKLDHRVQALEQQRAELRAEWQAARTRIETAMKELRK